MVLYVVVPCFNEEAVLPVTAPLFVQKMRDLCEQGKISAESKVLFVDDGSRDTTWDVIRALAKETPEIEGIRQSRNRGHQNALLAGLMQAKDRCDITISIDCDGQDDIDAMDRMVDEFLAGCDVVYGVRSDRGTDSFFKRITAQAFYKFLSALGAEIVYNHADYRLLSSRVLQNLAEFKEVNLFLRGMIPLVGFRSTSVYYERHARIRGESQYSLKKMMTLAADGITSLSIKPIHLVMKIGILTVFLSFAGGIMTIYEKINGQTVEGWASLVCIILFLSGTQMISLGVIGEYIGKIYLESKHRPRYIISETTEDKIETVAGK